MWARCGDCRVACVGLQGVTGLTGMQMEGTAMNRYQLAKLTGWAEVLQARKRLQKVVFLLQTAGCPLNFDFTLHRYGPYSQEVARLSDEMVRSGLLEESVGQNAMGCQYSYRLPESTKQQIAELEASSDGQKWAEQIAPFEGLARELLTADLRQLEYASTIAYFRRKGLAWPASIDKACAFKRTQSVRDAEPLARKVIA